MAELSLASAFSMSLSQIRKLYRKVSLSQSFYAEYWFQVSDSVCIGTILDFLIRFNTEEPLNPFDTQRIASAHLNAAPRIDEPCKSTVTLKVVSVSGVNLLTCLVVYVQIDSSLV